MEPERKAAVVEGLSAAVREAVSDLGITNEEWMEVLGFLTQVGLADEFILLSDTMKVSVLVDRFTHDRDDGATASNVLGPFYIPGAPFLEAPYDLAGADEPGEPLFVSGTVTSGDTGRPLAGAVLDLWQADDDRLYSIQDPSKDPFHLRGRIRVRDDGRYAFRTVTPPPYEIPKDGPVGTLLTSLGRHHFRPAHLHVKAAADQHEELTTMIFMAEDPWLPDDTIGAVKESLIADLVRHSDPQAMASRGVDRPFATAEFDIRLRPAGP
jgi:protocatechuate 3,4-dioxygenase beta subunit